MPSFVYDKRKADFLGKLINVAAAGDSLKAMLLTSSYTPSPGVDNVYADISANEVTGTGYTAGGNAVAGQAVTVTLANSWATTRATNLAYTLGQVVRPSTGNGFVYRCTVAGTSAGDVVPTSNTNVSPAVLTANGHGLANGNAVTIAGVTTATAFNAPLIANAVTTNTWDALTAAAYAQINVPGVGGWGSATIAPTWPTVIGQSITDGTVTWTCVGTSVIKWGCTNPSWTTATITARYCVIYDVTVSNDLILCLDFGGNVSSTAGTFTVSLDASSGGFDLF